MDRLEAMSVLLAVVDAGTISAASRRLGLPLTTVSRKISALEAHLNTRLLVRGSTPHATHRNRPCLCCLPAHSG